MLSIFLGTGVVVSLLATASILASIAGISVALANTYRLVAKPEQTAREHEKWCQEWAELLAEVHADKTPTQKTLSKWIKRVQHLNSQCFEDMKAVKAHVYNETMTALGRKGRPYTLSWLQRQTKHYLPHTHGFDSQNLAG